ncbi:MAG TPA: peptidase M20, partial [Rhodoferax sp.]|nr:peptidase M20 [Rhodoferax sp.]
MNDRVPHTLLNAAQTLSEVSTLWDMQIVPRLQDYIRVPAKSPMFDADWAANGYIDTVVRDTAAWIEAQNVQGLTLEVVRLPGRTPVLFFEVAGTKVGSTQTVLMYGH